MNREIKVYFARQYNIYRNVFIDTITNTIYNCYEIENQFCSLRAIIFVFVDDHPIPTTRDSECNNNVEKERTEKIYLCVCGCVRARQEKKR